MILRVLVALAVATGLVTAACSDDEEDIPSPTPGNGTVAPTDAATPTPAATPSPTPTDSEPTPTPDPGPATDAAVDALATWLGPVADPASISVESAEAIIWSDGCLGLRRPGRACTQALVEGFRVILSLGNGTYEVRTDVSGDVVLWAPSVQVLAQFQEGLTNLFLFTTDDGGTLEAQPVPGTDYGVDPDTLMEGDPVSVALADAPQDGPQLLVWLDPVQE